MDAELYNRCVATCSKNMRVGEDWLLALLQMNARLNGRPETDIEKGDVSMRLNERVSAVHHLNLALLNRKSNEDTEKT